MLTVPSLCPLLGDELFRGLFGHGVGISVVHWSNQMLTGLPLSPLLAGRTHLGSPFGSLRVGRLGFGTCSVLQAWQPAMPSCFLGGQLGKNIRGSQCTTRGCETGFGGRACAGNTWP